MTYKTTEPNKIIINQIVTHLHPSVSFQQMMRLFPTLLIILATVMTGALLPSYAYAQVAGDSSHFVLKVRTTAANEMFTFYTQVQVPSVAYDIDWNGDRDFDDLGDAIGVSGNQSHIFSAAGDHIVRFRNLTNIRIDGGNDADKYISVEQWGTATWVANMSRAFEGARNLTFVAGAEIPDMSAVTDMSFMFTGATSFNQDIGEWDVSSVTTMESMFLGATSFNQDIGEWNVSNVTAMNSMFHNATSFDQDIGEWGVSSLKGVSDMFENATLSIENYEALLIGWVEHIDTTGENVPPIFDGGNSKYSSLEAKAAHTLLQTGRVQNTGRWGGIVDGGITPSFGTKTVTAQTYTVGRAITNLTLPEAMGGNGDLTYSLTDLPAGLEFDADTRIISGTPTDPATVTTYTLTASDADSTTQALTFSITVNAPLSFSMEAVPNQTYTMGTVVSLILPAATGGNGILTYSLSGNLPAGLTFNTSTYTISGIPTAITATAPYTLTATDTDSDTATLTFNITVAAPPVATIEPVADSFYTTIGTVRAIPENTEVTLDGSSSTGTTPLTYLWTQSSGPTIALSGETTAMPSFTTPTAVSGSLSIELQLIVTDANDTASPAVSVVLFVHQFQPVADAGDDQTVTAGATVRLDGSGSLQPASGSGTLGYTWTQTDGTDVILDQTNPAMPTFTAPTNSTSSNDLVLTFSLTTQLTTGLNVGIVSATDTVNIVVNTAPSFGTETVTAQTYTMGTVVSLTLPAATGGNGSLTYTLTGDLPAGLTFNADTRIITGTPTEPAVSATYTLTATDADTNTDATDADTLMFSITVNPAAPIIAASTNTVAAIAGTAIPTITISSTGGVVASYSIAPSIENGLTFDAITGSISGAPDAQAGSITYIIAATNVTGTDTDTVTITVNPAIPVITASTNTVTAIAGIAITPITITTTVSSGTVDSYSIAPDIENDLSFDTTTGAISGTPTAPADSITYIIAATNVTGAGTVTVTITVNAPDTAPSFGTARVDDQTYTVGTAITALTLPEAADGNGTLTYALSPALPAGLAFDADTRTISGTPSATVTIKTYTLTATDADSDTAALTFSITVNPTVTLPGNIQQLNEAIMPRLIHDMVASTVAAVGNRIDATFSREAQAASYQLDGQTVQLDAQSSLSTNLQDTLQMKLPHYAQSLKAGTMDWKQMLSNSSFVLPLNASDGGGDGAEDGAEDAGVTVWGSGNYIGLSDKNDKVLDWEGDVFSIQLGVDGRVGVDGRARDDLLVGGLLSWSKGDVDYTQRDRNNNNVSGKYQHQVTSVHPYMAWSNGGTRLWSSVGYGQGKLEIVEGSTASSSDTRLLSLATGVKGALPQVAGLSVKSDIALVQIRIDTAADAQIPVQNLDSQRVRLLLELEDYYRLASGSVFRPMLEIGVRYDGGDGDTGVGVVLGHGIRFNNVATGLTVEGKVHALLGQKNYQEWGVQGVIRQVSNADGRGLSFSLSPRYGHTGSNANQVWEQKLPVEDGNQTDDYDMQVKARLGYGMFAPGGGLLTPYSEVTVGDQARRNYRLGIHWNPDSPFNLHLLGERQENSGGIDTHRVLLESTIRF